jgi:hypothetical protein
LGRHGDSRIQSGYFVACVALVMPRQQGRSIVRGTAFVNEVTPRFPDTSGSYFACISPAHPSIAFAQAVH